MEEDGVVIYKGSCLRLKKNELKSDKVFVFDLDETIGHFSEVYILFQCIEKMQNNGHTKWFEDDEQCLRFLLDLFPEVFRYGIDVIFQYLYKKKNTVNTSVYIYTNNSCIPITWTTYICKYIETYWKVDNLFTNIVRAFKINGKIVEKRRTTGEKSYIDFIHCVQLPYDTELCFLDNNEHKLMKHRHVYYLQPKPFYCDINRNEYISRFTEKFESFTKLSNVQEEVRKFYSEQKLDIQDYEKTYAQHLIDIKVSKKLLHCIQKFYKYKVVKLKTRKNRKTPVCKTLKKRCK
jgi:hypothetical protein